MSIELEEYLSADGAAPFTDWLEQLRDGMARVRVVKRLTRMKAGRLSNLLRPSWRHADRAAGGRVKRTQQQDIEHAQSYWQDWKRRKAR